MLKIELKKVSHNARLSQETPAYTAEIWVDGKFFCEASNHGHGGPDMHRPRGAMPAYLGAIGQDPARQVRRTRTPRDTRRMFQRHIERFQAGETS